MLATESRSESVRSLEKTPNETLMQGASMRAALKWQATASMQTQLNVGPTVSGVSLPQCW